MIDDEDRPRAQKDQGKTPYLLGRPLDTMSVGEIDERIAELRAEIGRLEAARAAKAASAAAAEMFFKK
jgi:uncharacterized small protein (DUF1192 family)